MAKMELPAWLYDILQQPYRDRQVREAPVIRPMPPSGPIRGVDVPVPGSYPVRADPLNAPYGPMDAAASANPAQGSWFPRPKSQMRPPGRMNSVLDGDPMMLGYTTGVGRDERLLPNVSIDPDFGTSATAAIDSAVPKPPFNFGGYIPKFRPSHGVFQQPNWDVADTGMPGTQGNAPPVFGGVPQVKQMKVGAGFNASAIAELLRSLKPSTLGTLAQRLSGTVGLAAQGGNSGLVGGADASGPAGGRGLLPGEYYDATGRRRGGYYDN